MDDLDFQILAALGNNSRKSYVELANELEVSDATVHNRIRSMIDSGIIKGFVTLVDFEKMGFVVMAFVEIMTKSGTADLVGPKLVKIKGVVGIYETHSHCDFLVKIVARDLKELRDKIVNEIGKIPEVLSSNNYVILNVAKDDWNPPGVLPHVAKAVPIRGNQRAD